MNSEPEDDLDRSQPCKNQVVCLSMNTTLVNLENHSTIFAKFGIYIFFGHEILDGTWLLPGRSILSPHPDPSRESITFFFLFFAV